MPTRAARVLVRAWSPPPEADRTEEQEDVCRDATHDVIVVGAGRFNYLSTERDRARMRQMIRTVVALLRTEAFWPDFKKLTEIDEKTLADDRLLDGWARSRIITSLHTAGTAKTGRADHPQAVVDQQGRVYGVEGLRVVDMSMLPEVPSRGPAATAVMIGGKVADMMRAETTPVEGRLQAVIG